AGEGERGGPEGAARHPGQERVRAAAGLQGDRSAQDHQRQPREEEGAAQVGQVHQPAGVPRDPEDVNREGHLASRTLAWKTPFGSRRPWTTTWVPGLKMSGS